MDLKFCKMPVDTTLAQSYMKNFEKNANIRDNIFYDGHNYYNTVKEIPIKVRNANEKINFKVKSNLVKKLKENMDLLVQLEYLVRDIPIEDTKAQINIIIQQLNYHYLIYCDWLESCPSYIYMGKNMPLLKLGFVAKILRENGDLIFIYAEQPEAPVCALFTELCHEAGIPVVTKFISDFSTSDKAHLLSSQNISPTSGVGAVSVICEHSDVDSAVDILLKSSAKAPWRLQRILVQESVWQHFKDALTWKCNLHNATKTLEYGGRVFLLDQPSMKEPQPTEIYVDTFRTTKELLSLLNEYPTKYLSVWASNIAEVNEITHSVRTPFIWVNNFADFRGPSQISEVLCSYKLFENDKISFKNDQARELVKLRKSWVKHSVETRRRIICEVLKECDQHELDYLDVESVMYGSDGSSVYSMKDYVCTIIQRECKRFLYVENGREAVKTVRLYEKVINGNAVALDPSTFSETLRKDIGKFKDAGVPIVYVKSSEKLPLDDDIDGLSVLSCVIDEKTRDFYCKIKVIWTNSGTIFAN